MKFELWDEFRLRQDQREAIGHLLSECFPGCGFGPHRLYFKQLPPWRLLAFERGQLVGQAAVDYRRIGTSTGPSIFGIVDICVLAPVRGQRIASRMLAWLEGLAIEHSIEFLVLFAQDARLYDRHGYRRALNPLRWVRIHEHEILGIGEEPLEELMVKPMTARGWPPGPIDLLGHVF